MCRITGIWTQKDPDDLSRVCATMRDTMQRGGPDDAGLHVDRAAGLALGHRRLSVIDLSPTGHQPMTSGNHTLCYNGETYNYRELRAELQRAGATFQGSSDSEVVLKAFVRWGPECVTRLNGMFAFALWDAGERALYLFRDRLGVKPLYYYRHDGVFAFASELKALHAGLGDRLEIDRAALGEFFHYGYISAPRSIYRHVHKVEPGHWLRIDSEHVITSHRYWSADQISPQTTTGEADLIDELETLLVDAFKKRLIADVPVGVFLSGGIDSSLVTALLARHTDTPLKTFTIGFHERHYDESGWAGKIARHLGTEHTEKIVTPEHAREILPLWPQIYDEPFGDISGIPTTIVARMTRDKVKVSLSADGGDELFCGYHRYRVLQHLQERLQHMPPPLIRTGGNLLGLPGADRVADLARILPRFRLPALKDRFRKLQAVLRHWTGDAAAAYPFAVGYWLPHEIARLTGDYTDPRRPLSSFRPPGNKIRAEDQSLVEAMMRWDLHHYLPDDILTKIDRATMFCSLEGRDPFLDHRIVEFAQSLPLEYKYKNGEMKYILKKILARHLPRELFDRPKQGFAVPVYQWLHDDLMHLIDTFLNPDVLRDQTLIDPLLVGETVREFKQKNGSIAVDRLWLLLVFMMWQEEYR